MTQALPAPAMMVRVDVRETVRATGVEGVLMGTEAEFAALYEARFTDLSGQLHAYLGDATEAQDVVQEAFVRAWQRWAKISQYEDPVAWIRRVAWNLATSRHRRIAVVRRFVARSGPPEVQPAAGPDRVALVAALRMLPEQQRRAVVLHYLGDLSVTDIAQDVGVAVGTVKSWLHRGRTELAKLLSESPSPQQGAPQRGSAAGAPGRGRAAQHSAASRREGGG